jgi:predicted GNAT superfamily acetyltransferase
MAGRVVVRSLRAPSEYRQAQEVARRAWGWPDLDLPPITDLIAGAHVGGLVAGAFAGGTMLGFVSGLPRLGMGALYLFER